MVMSLIISLSDVGCQGCRVCVPESKWVVCNTKIVLSHFSVCVPVLRKNVKERMEKLGVGRGGSGLWINARTLM